MCRGDTINPHHGCDLAQFPQLAELSERTLEELAGICRILNFRTGQIVAHEGETPDFIGCVLGGILRLQKTLGDGRQHIVGLLVEGDMFGGVFDAPLNVSIEVAADARVCAFQRAAFEALVLRSPDLGRVVLMNILGELDRARDWMAILAIPKVRGRLAGFLLSLCARFGSIHHPAQSAKGVFNVRIPINRADQANLLGTRPESISRAYHALADDGGIAIMRPDLIEIRDIAALGAAADDGAGGNPEVLREWIQLLQARTE